MYLYSDVVTIDPELRPEAQALRTALGADRPEDGVPASRASILMVSARSCASARPYVVARTPRGRVLVVIITGRPPDEQVWQLMAAGASDVICDRDLPGHRAPGGRNNPATAPLAGHRRPRRIPSALESTWSGSRRRCASCSARWSRPRSSRSRQCCSSARAALARSWWRGCCTTSTRVPTREIWCCSTAPRSCRHCPGVNSSATRRAHSPGRRPPVTVPSPGLTAGRSFSTRSASCPFRSRLSCCEWCRRVPTSASAATSGSGPCSGWCARPTGTCWPSSGTGGSATTSTTGSLAWSSSCRRCAAAGRMSCRCSRTFWPSSTRTAMRRCSTRRSAT